MTIPAGLGQIIAILVLVLAIVLAFVGQLPLVVAALVAAPERARLT